MHHKPNAVQSISDFIEQKRDLYIRVSDQISNYAETRYEEYQSAELMASILEQEGFIVERSAGGIATAVVGSYGHGKPVIAILGEYDALSGLSQEKGETHHVPVVDGGNGHGCGHNLLGSGMLAAAVAVKSFMEKHRLAGTIRYYGCPAEEGGGGKGIMARNGLFDDVDAALTWHPESINAIMTKTTLATCQVYFKFKGRSAHAGVSPHLGRGALDAVELMNVGANYLREHLIPEARLHYAVTNTGGTSPNVVQAEAEVLYKLRIPRSEMLADMYERVCNLARGAALMTGTELEIQFDAGSSELIMNRTLEKLMFDSFAQLGIPEFDEAEKAFASRIRATLTGFDPNDNVPAGLENQHLSDRLEPYDSKGGLFPGSTDVGDVSWKAPTAQCMVACVALGTPFHTWQVVSQGATSIAHKGMLHAGKVVGATAAELLLRPELLAQAKEEHRKELGGRGYKCPIPADVMPGPVKR